MILPFWAIAQNLEPTQAEFYLPARDATIPLSNANDYFQQTKFVKGVHWDYTPRLGRVLGMTQQDISYNFNSAILNPNTLLHIKIPDYSTHCQRPELVNARGIEYSPILLINPNLTHTVQKCNTNTTSTKNPVFGFQTIVGSKFCNDDYLLIDGTVPTGEVILENPWPNDKLNVLNPFQYSGNDEIDYFWRGMYVTINLRRTGLMYISDEQPILKIEVPYSYKNSAGDEFNDGMCYFHDLPDASAVYSFQYGRGDKLGLKSYTTLTPPVPPQYFEIKRNMLPQNNDNITISAFIYLDQVKRPNTIYHNYFLQGKGFNNDPNDPLMYNISKLKLKVTYLGNEEVAINWIRFETPATRNLLSGIYDDDIKTKTQSVLTKFATSSLEVNGIKFFRFNTHIEGGMQQWIGERYLVKLLGNLISGEAPEPIYTHLYEHYVPSADRWMGMMRSMTTVSVPFNN